MKNSAIPTYQTLAKQTVYMIEGYNLVAFNSPVLMPVNTMIVIEQVTGLIAADDTISYQYDDYLFDTSTSSVAVLTSKSNAKIRFYARPLYSCKNTQAIKLSKTYNSTGVYNLTVYTDMNSNILNWKEITVKNLNDCKLDLKSKGWLKYSLLEF